MRLVFVYGTLRRGESRDINQLQPPPVTVGTGVVSGVLYDLGTYPGLVLQPGCDVTGEVYQICAALEHQLDVIEEVWPGQGGEYQRRDVLVRMVHPLADIGRWLTCLVYEATSTATAGKPVIASGNWVGHVHSGRLMS